MGFRDECGVVGVYGAPNASALTYFGLVSLQHRGQESAGIAVSDGNKLILKKALGLVTDVFKTSDFENLKGNIHLIDERLSTVEAERIFVT